MANQYFPTAIPGNDKVQGICSSTYVVAITKVRGPWTCQMSRSVRQSTGDITSIPLQAFPEHYREHIRRFTWRLSTLSMILRFTKEHELPKEKKFYETLKRTLVYMDNIANFLLSDAQAVAEEDRTVNWRCRTFDLYLVTECLVKRHEPEAVREYRRRGDMNINRVSLDDLGKSCIQSQQIFYNYEIYRLERLHHWRKCTVDRPYMELPPSCGQLQLETGHSSTGTCSCMVCGVGRTGRPH